MAELTRRYAAADESVAIHTELEDPIAMAYKFFVFAGAQEHAQQYAAIGELFHSLSQDNWDEDWDQRCENANISTIKNYLALALKLLAEISEADGQLMEPFHGRFKAVAQADQVALWESGFFHWEKEDQVKPREFISALHDFIVFLDEVTSSGSDLLRRIED